MGKILEELYGYTIIEEERELTLEEEARYLEIYAKLQANDVEIPFGIEI